MVWKWEDKYFKTDKIELHAHGNINIQNQSSLFDTHNCLQHDGNCQDWFTFTTNNMTKLVV